MRYINYLWIGPPASRETGVISGQDSIGPMTFKGENCRFWCLVAHADHYKTVFARQDNVTVMPIEPYLSTCASDEAKRTQALFLKLLSDDRGSVRDRVSAKELFSFFLLAQSGGYVADSNVLLKSPELLAEYDCFTFACYSTRRTLLADVDIWMMYSPPRFERTLLSLQELIAAFEGLETRGDTTATAPVPGLFKTKDLNNAYSDASCRALLAPGLDQTGYWKISQENEGDATAKLLGIGAEKHFFNTHRPDAALDQAFMYLQAGEFEALSYLLACGEDINQTMNQAPMQNLTLLQSAIWRQNPDAVAFILEHKPDLSKKATYGSRNFTAAQFITFLLDLKPSDEQKEKLQACQEILAKYMAAASAEAATSTADVVTGSSGGSGGGAELDDESAPITAGTGAGLR